MSNIICTEKYGSQPIKRSYIRHEGANSVTFSDESQKITSVTHILRSIFLPQGYPESVSDDYTQYQIWDTVQAFASAITGTLATHAVLKGVGVGDESATVLAATITWLMKSGTGMVGQIMFAWMKGTYLDCECKRWRLFADMLNDFAIFLEILAPAFTTYFRVVVCTAGVCKAIVGVAGGATRAALTQHQARRNNMADVAAKDGSQETLVNLSALLCSLVLMPLVAENYGVIWVLYLMFTMMHLFANYSAVTSVAMETFNEARLHIVVDHYLHSRSQSVMSVKAANYREPVLWGIVKKSQITLGASVENLLNRCEDLQALFHLYQSHNYIVHLDLKHGKTNIVLHETSTITDQLKAFYQAEILEYAVRQARWSTASTDSVALMNIVEAIRHDDALSACRHSLIFADETFEGFLSACHACGWVSHCVLLGADEWRANWTDPKKAF